MQGSKIGAVELIGTLSRQDIAVLVAAELSLVGLGEALSLGVSREHLDRLVEAGLLIHVQGDPVLDGWKPTQLGVEIAEAVCPKCYAAMSSGKALIGPYPGITYEGQWPARFRDCLKCHSCGHSEHLPKSSSAGLN